MGAAEIEQKCTISIKQGYISLVILIFGQGIVVTRIQDFFPPVVVDGGKARVIADDL